MTAEQPDGEYSRLCVSPFGIKSMLLQNIDKQIALGKNGYICIKANSVTEREVIDKPAEASCAGVEIACPVQDMELREQLKWILDTQLRDTAKASLMLPNGSYCRKQGAVPFGSQDYFMQQSPHIPTEPISESSKLMLRLRLKNLVKNFCAKLRNAFSGLLSIVKL